MQHIDIKGLFLNHSGSDINVLQVCNDTNANCGKKTTLVVGEALRFSITQKKLLNQANAHKCTFGTFVGLVALKIIPDDPRLAECQEMKKLITPIDLY